MAESEYLLKRREIMLGLREATSKKDEKKKKEASDNKEILSADKEFYIDIWNASPHICQCGCNKKLGNEPLTIYFHHLLPKSKYPEFRHTPENIMILAPDCHSQVEVDIDKRPLVRQRRDQVLQLLLNK